jgi:hypothetical protein
MRKQYLQRIYRLKLLLLGTVLALIGILTSILADWLSETTAPHLFVSLLSALADVLVVTGAIGIAVDFFTGTDKDAADTERLRSLLKEAAPDFRDAVISGFAETPENMRGVATTQTLDKLATNALALRLGDAKFAAEIYQGLLAQAIRTPERWHDVDVNVRLSSIDESSTVGAARDSLAELLFDVVVTWEYTLVPSTRIQRFASTNDLDEFRDFLNDVPATSAWYVPEGSADAREPTAFEVLSYSADGKDLKIRRDVRRSGQTYSVDLGAELLFKKQPVRIRHVYRTVVSRPGHRFRIGLTQPTERVRILLDYTETDIADLKVGDLVSSAAPTEVKFLPTDAPAKQVEVTVPGWVLPQAEVTFVWTLEGELPAHRRSRALDRAS